MPKVLVINHDLPASEIWLRTLEDTLGHDTEQALHLERATSRLKKARNDYSLIVLPANARPDADALGSSGCDAVVAFISELKELEIKVPVIVISETRHPALHVLASVIDQMALIECQADWRECLADRAWQMVSSAVDDGPEVDVEIRVDSDRRCTWSMKERGRITADAFSNQLLYIDPDKFVTVQQMRRPPVADDEFAIWSDNLARNVHAMLFQGAADQLKFHGHFVDATAKVPPERRRVRICSSLDSHHDMHLDVFKRLYDDNGPMMLESPVIRQHGSRRTNQPLFSRKNPLRCLVILARDAATTVTSQDGQVVYPGLKNAKFEAKEVETLFKLSAKADPSLIDPDHVKLLEFQPGDDVKKLLFATLENDPWHLIHFVGHGRTVPNREESGPGKRGELLLCSRDLITIDFEDFARRIERQDTRMLFLSACQTAQGAFLSAAAHWMLPTVIGYRWPIQDSRAKVFAKIFYEGLLNTRQPTGLSIERSFVAARANAYRNSATDCTWASPALLHQIDY
jgi:hypothetical protein